MLMDFEVGQGIRYIKPDGKHNRPTVGYGLIIESDSYMMQVYPVLFFDEKKYAPLMLGQRGEDYTSYVSGCLSSDCSSDLSCVKFPNLVSRSAMRFGCISVELSYGRTMSLVWS